MDLKDAMRPLAGCIVRTMPDDYWPPMGHEFSPGGGVKVVSAAGDDALGFLVTDEEAADGLLPKMMAQRIGSLRCSMWQLSELRRQGTRVIPGTSNPAR